MQLRKFAHSKISKLLSTFLKTIGMDFSIKRRSLYKRLKTRLKFQPQKLSTAT